MFAFTAAAGATKKMKRHNGLYQQIYALPNIRTAHQNARRGKGQYSEVKMVNADPEKYFLEIHNQLKTKSFINSQYEMFKKTERGKTREIYKLPYYPDRIIHHAIMQVLEPIWMSVFIRDTYASMKNRGIHDGVNRMKLFLRDAPGTKYCLKIDVRKFYPSIDHDILKTIIRRKIKCRETLWLLDAIIDSAPGVPIGNYLSQYMANLYLAYFDHWAKDILGIRYYARYCDDIVMLSNSKHRLRDIYNKVNEYLNTNLKLEIKSNWQIFPTAIRGIDFLGYRFFGDKILVRKSIVKEFCKKIDALKKRDAKQADANSAMSYYGWLLHANASGLWNSKMTHDIKKMLMAACGCQSPKILTRRF